MTFWGLPLIRAVKSGVSVIFGASIATFIFGQFGDFDFGAIGNVTGIAAIAVVVGRYTFRQLEDYRKDLSLARSRGDIMEQRMDVMEARERLLFTHVTRMERALISSGVANGEIPAFPELPDVPALPALAKDK